MRFYLFFSTAIPLFGTLADNQEVVIRGFVYTTDEGHRILSSEPHLKSCCLGSSEKSQSQIFLDSTTDTFSPHRAVTLQGTLLKKNGAFHLENPRVVQEKGIWLGWIVILLLPLLGLIWAYKQLFY